MQVYGENFWQQIVITFSPPSDLLLKSNFILNNNTWSLSNIGNCSAICSKHQFLILYTWFCALHWPQRSCWNINICKIECWTKSVCPKSRNSMQIYREYREHRLDYRIYGYTSSRYNQGGGGAGRGGILGLTLLFPHLF